MKDKAPYGTPCNSCGQCCAEELCPIACLILQKPIRHQMRCPFLTFDGAGDSSCGVVKDPTPFNLVGVLAHGVDKVKNATLTLIGAGYGCDARVPGEADAPRGFQEGYRHHRGPNGMKHSEAWKIWGVRA